MLKDIRMENQAITSKSAFLKELKSKLPDFFVGESFDMDKFKRNLAKESIQTELSSGYQLDFVGKNYAKNKQESFQKRWLFLISSIMKR